MSYINTLPDAPLEPPEEPTPICPICGAGYCDAIYYNIFGDIVGCDECITTRKPEDEPACFPDKD